MMIEQFLAALNENPHKVQFTDTMQVIDTNYDFSPCEFKNGKFINEANQNNGSCKLLAFAKLNSLSPELTLQCFGDYYRVDVLQHPQNEDHQNIRNFMIYGWDGIEFKQLPLALKNA